MKRLLSTALLCLIASFLFARGWTSQAISKNDVFIQTGTGFGPTPFAVNSGIYPLFMASMEYAAIDYLSFGPYVGTGFKRNSHIHYNIFATGGAVSFHFWQLIENKSRDYVGGDVLDVYVSFSLGYEKRVRSVAADNFSSKIKQNQFYSGPTAGLKYIPWDNVGFYLEGGKGALGFLVFGLTYRITP